MEAQRFGTHVAILLVVGIVGLTVAGTPGTITDFTFFPVGAVATSATVDVGSTVSFRCRVDYNASSNRHPYIHVKKWFNGTEWMFANNEEFEKPFILDRRYSSNIINNEQNGVDVYEWTITDVKLGDTANYTCFTGLVNTSMANISLNVSAEPTKLNLYIDDELQPQSSLAAVNKKTLVIGQKYRISCVASGGNPFPNVTFYRGPAVVTPNTTEFNELRNDTVFPGSVNRSTRVNFTITMDVHQLGVPISCTAGVKNLNSSRNSFIPMAEILLPQFQCPDQFQTVPNQQTFTMTCKFYGTNVTSYYVSWSNATKSITGIKGIDVQAPADSRFSLRIDGPQGIDIWWTMTLTVSNPSSVTDLSTNKYHFVIVSSNGPAAHDVTVAGAANETYDNSGAMTLSSVGCLVVLLSAYLVTVLGRP